MSTKTDLYTLLFGKDQIKDGSVIEFAEHGRSGGVDSGQGFKFTNDVAENMLVNDTDGVNTYIGISKPGNSDKSVAYWQIFKVTDQDGLTEILYADGNDNYDNIWNDILSLSYS